MDAQPALTRLALWVLSQTVEQARQGRVSPSPGLRLALGYLYAVGDRRKEHFDRAPYDEFWHLATKEDATLEGGHNVDGYCRLNGMRVCINGIARAAGSDPVT